MRTRIWLLLAIASAVYAAPLRARAQDSMDLKQVFPLPPIGPQDPKVCEDYSRQVSAIKAKYDKMHSDCLDAHKRDPEINANGNDLVCSKSSCQDLHDIVYGSQGKQADGRIADCNKAVQAYQAELEKLKEEAEERKRKEEEEKQREEAAAKKKQEEAAAQQKKIADAKEIARKKAEADAQARLEAQRAAEERRQELIADDQKKLADAQGVSQQQQADLAQRTADRQAQVPALDDAIQSAGSDADARLSQAQADVAQMSAQLLAAPPVSAPSPSNTADDFALPPDPSLPATRAVGSQILDAVIPSASADDTIPLSVRNAPAPTQVASESAAMAAITAPDGTTTTLPATSATSSLFAPPPTPAKHYSDDEINSYMDQERARLAADNAKSNGIYQPTLGNQPPNPPENPSGFIEKRYAAADALLAGNAPPPSFDASVQPQTAKQVSPDTHNSATIQYYESSARPGESDNIDFNNPQSPRPLYQWTPEQTGATVLYEQGAPNSPSVYNYPSEEEKAKIGPRTQFVRPSQPASPQSSTDCIHLSQSWQAQIDQAILQHKACLAYFDKGYTGPQRPVDTAEVVCRYEACQEVHNSWKRLEREQAASVQACKAALPAP